MSDPSATGPRAQLRGLASALGAADASSPVEALESVTRELGLTLGATSVSFLIADISGRALVRLAHVPLADPARGTTPRETLEGED